MNKKPEYDAALEKAKHLYESTSLSVRDIADDSDTLLGVNIPFNTLRAAQADQGWEKKKSGGGDPVVIENMKRMIVGRLFNTDGSPRSSLDNTEAVKLMDMYVKLSKSDIKTPGGLAEGQEVFGRTQLLDMDSNDPKQE